MQCWLPLQQGANGPAEATATPSTLASLKTAEVVPFWYWLTHVVLEKR